MTETPSRFSDASQTSRMCSGRLSRPACLLCLGIDVEAEFGGDHHPVAHRLQRLADHLLIGEGAIDLGGVEEGDAALYRRAYQRDALLLTHRSCVAEVESHAAVADG